MTEAMMTILTSIRNKKQLEDVPEILKEEYEDTIKNVIKQDLELENSIGELREYRKELEETYNSLVQKSTQLEYSNQILERRVENLSNLNSLSRAVLSVLDLDNIINIILDPIFIFYFNLGISGAAIATIISQLLSVIWVMKFLLGDKTILKLNKKSMKLESELSKNIMGLGLAGFVMSATNGAVQIACNATLKGHGGDVYIGIMTVLSSIRDVIMLPIHGVTTGAQPVLGYNYGAKKYDRIKKGIFFITIVTVIYMLITWIVVFIFPENFIKVFSSDNELLVKGIPAMNIYYFGFFMMAFQVAGQSIFVALGQSKQAVFFSLFRKIIVVVPLTLFLPYVANLGVKGVFLAEPISNFVGGTACYIAMLMTIRKILKDEREKI